jgi:hypothetical protein
LHAHTEILNRLASLPDHPGHDDGPAGIHGFRLLKKEWKRLDD